MLFMSLNSLAADNMTGQYMFFYRLLVWEMNVVVKTHQCLFWQYRTATNDYISYGKICRLFFFLITACYIGCQDIVKDVQSKDPFFTTNKSYKF